MEQSSTKTTLVRFIVVVVVLMLLTFGVFFALRQQDSVATTPAPEVSLNTDEANKPADSSSENPQEHGAIPSGDSPAAPATNGAESRDDRNNPAAPAAPATSNPSEFSQTGPADTLAQLIVVGLIVASVTAYARSHAYRQLSL